ncbi:hypothetical protein C7M84_012055 [Penaeus vannamei]|uniref:G-patch domain-containing protein n=1 Tax=Penaeus vannamei TaxID=6689 RepID=A0A423T005_PENVA|nr:hypothetical protein C7M84_012055 [Penaeus vannamei]
MADSEEEIDYMSEDFLAQCVGNNDVRPGLLFSHSSKRSAQIEKQRKNKNESNRERFKPVKQVQQERLQEGLNTALDSSNKGFAMLQKMGYKPGSSLGKQGQGKLEPVAVELKADRVGLGWQEMISEHRKKQQEIKRQKQEKHKKEIDPEQFRARMRSQQQEKLINADLMKSQRICHQMDSKAELTEPVEPWFWPNLRSLFSSCPFPLRFVSMVLLSVPPSLLSSCPTLTLIGVQQIFSSPTCPKTSPFVIISTHGKSNGTEEGESQAKARGPPVEKAGAPRWRLGWFIVLVVFVLPSLSTCFGLIYVHLVASGYTNSQVSPIPGLMLGWLPNRSRSNKPHPLLQSPTPECHWDLLGGDGRFLVCLLDDLVWYYVCFGSLRQMTPHIHNTDDTTTSTIANDTTTIPDDTITSTIADDTTSTIADDTTTSTIPHDTTTSTIPHDTPHPQ